MKVARKHRSKIVLLRFFDGTYWEEWELRFNRGSKQKKPVKFFAVCNWRSDYSRNVIPWCAQHFDYANERTAEKLFVEDVMKKGAEVLESTPALLRMLNTTFGKP